MPEDVVFVKELPHTATGKLSKLTLRQQMKEYKLPS
jgi:acyl-coenzyme A synthetase/AMP-(fatty) acid ligase